MKTNVRYTMTNDTVTVIVDGKTTMVREGATNFASLRKAITNEDWDSVVKNLEPKSSFLSWSKGKFSFDGTSVKMGNEVLPDVLSSRIVELAGRGEDSKSICLFWEKLRKNPSNRSVSQLWGFLQHAGIPLTADGNFRAYKSVRRDYFDHHSGTILNKPGTTIEMERNKISDDPDQACHYGLHVGALNYASSFGSGDRFVLIVEVDPADVVCIPRDSNQEKMRVCKYKVIGVNSGGLMDSSLVDDSEDPEDDTADVDEFFDEVSPAKSVTVPKKYAKLHSLDMGELLEQTTEKLRDYATNGLKIVGASKISGGKFTLVTKIIDVRGF